MSFSVHSSTPNIPIHLSHLPGHFVHCSYYIQKTLKLGKQLLNIIVSRFCGNYGISPITWLLSCFVFIFFWHVTSQSSFISLGVIKDHVYFRKTPCTCFKTLRRRYHYLQGGGVSVRKKHPLIGGGLVKDTLVSSGTNNVCPQLSHLIMHELRILLNELVHSHWWYGNSSFHLP